ncbi:MAG: Flp pilus assembly protein TadD, partial [Planctomycetota bacterium]
MVDKNKKRVQKDKKRREALRKAKTVVRMSPQELEFESKRAYQALRDNAPLRAEKIARKALRAKPDHPQLLATLTTALDQLDRIEEAVLTAKRLVEVQPGNPDAHDILGATYKFNGRLDDAAASFLRATELNPQHAAAWRNFASVHRFDDPGAAVLTAMREALDRAPARGPARISLEFALGKALSDLGQVDESFKFYHQANYHKRIGIPFSSDAQSRSIDSLIGSIGEEFLGHGPAPAASKDAPILVVGMPRSGSTLVEQILASHPSVVGVGEVSDLFDTLAPV